MTTDQLDELELRVQRVLRGDTTMGLLSRELAEILSVIRDVKILHSELKALRVENDHLLDSLYNQTKSREERSDDQ